jgi:hypothetical protein
MNAYRIDEDTGATLALAVVVIGVATSAASAAGAFEGLPMTLFAFLTGFLAAFAVATYFLDPGVRGFIARRSHSSRGVAAVVLNAAIAIDLWIAPWDERLASFPHAFVVLFVWPLAAVAAAAFFDRWGAARRFRSPATKSPGATPAAT